MDFVALAYYAVVCGVLGAIAPRIHGMFQRFGIGVLVGIAAAAALPFLRLMFGF